MSNSFVKLDIEGAVGTLTFFTPEHNALPTAILTDLEQQILKADANTDLKVLVIKSGGDRTFCAGASFKELIAIENEAQGKLFFMGFAKVILAMRASRLLTILRVQGKAVGGGVGLAAAADYCLASQYSSIKLSEISIGIGPFVIGPAVTRKIGVSAFSQMTINAQEFYSAEWAKEKGVYAEVLNSAEELDAAVAKLANQLATYNPKALAECKKMFWSGTEGWKKLLEDRATTSGKLVLSEFTRNKLKSYA
ncbi:enoyl-CoA hydratase/isomerase family protein [Leeuwenhoekiella polynyae]|uniref:Methylglutaconyl-CoA hydratase n=1 Tax=Leeuwenhoekiella polynyae TaxID=1550906 RepID=A0A4Q0P0N9_9FLAO|nr:enoyl-CoA hydratase/isomerase family protein [Leeuwenhoekiella polynyae]RXG20033.1 methylglutaconyl-CoA hydratase [Leeuwenhoekiella polynyae]|tara:strand:- start:480 stop:1232 length:753 start_codon:yes stop_codon:yes gene_type:complete